MSCTKCKTSLDTGLKCTKCGYENEVKIPSPPIMSRIYQSLIDSPLKYIILLAPMILRELGIIIPSVVYLTILILCMLHGFINGILLLHGKCKHFFNHYRKMPIDELEKHYERKAIYRYEGIVAIILSLIVLIILGGIFIDAVVVVLSGIFGLLATSLICGLYATKTKRFMKRERDIDDLEERG